MVDQQADCKYLVFGCGNPLLDIAMEVKDEALHTKYEFKGGNAILAEEKHK